MSLKFAKKIKEKSRSPPPLRLRRQRRFLDSASTMHMRSTLRKLPNSAFCLHLEHKFFIKNDIQLPVLGTRTNVWQKIL